LKELGVLVLDLYLPNLNKYIEIKGYLNPKSKEKLWKFIQLYQSEAENTFIIDGEIYGLLSLLFKNKILEWEE